MDRAEALSWLAALGSKWLGDGQSKRVQASELFAALAVEVPIDMVLHCPKCGAQHIDKPDMNPDWCDGCNPDNCGLGCGSTVTGKWLNPPHRSHQCHFCKDESGRPFVWRPADVPTNGVAAVKTKGKADSPIAHPPARSGAGSEESKDVR